MIEIPFLTIRVLHSEAWWQHAVDLYLRRQHLYADGNVEEAVSLHYSVPIFGYDRPVADFPEDEDAD